LWLIIHLVENAPEYLCDGKFSEVTLKKLTLKFNHCMKKWYLSVCLLLLAGLSAITIAQTNPGTANLKHQWTFDDGVVDKVGGVTGVLEGAATVSNKALNTTSGGFFSMPAGTIGINTYPELTLEVWFTPSSGVNTGFTMLSYFGNTTGTLGTDYIFISTARGDNVSRAAISTLNTSNPWTTESGVNGTEYDDGKLHHMIATINATNITFYVDGVNVGTAALSENNKLMNVGTAFAYLGKAGYTSDPTWRGNIHKFSIFNKALNDSEVLFLYQGGPEEQEVLTATISTLALDTRYSAEMFNVSGANLGSDISITAPAGITVLPASLPKNAKDVEVVVVWDQTTPVDGNILLKSGNNEVRIAVKTANDTECFVPLYTDVNNAVNDPGLNSLAFFAGWGTRNVSTIINDPANVYCGASSISVGDGIGTGAGSLDVTLTGALLPNTFYRVKAMVKTIGGTFQLGVWGWSAGQGDLNNQIDTQGEWMPLEFTFTTGSSLGNTQGMFWNNWACTGTLGFIDNWEFYEAIEPQLSASITSEAFDPDYKEIAFTVTGANLLEGVTITVPSGLTASPNTLPATAAGEPVSVVWDGVTPVNGEIVVSSSGISKQIAVKSTSVTNSSCFVPLYPEKQNIVSDPFVNKLANFGGWGGRGIVSIVTNPDSVYCGSHSGGILGGGSIDVMLTGKMKKNTAYIARAMVMTVGGHFQLGVWGMDALTPGDVQDSIDTQGSWMPISIEFATSDSLGNVQGMFFNNYQRSGKRGLIDNWELYELGGTSVTNPIEGYHAVYFRGNQLVTEFELAGQTGVSISVYNLQGAVVAQRNSTAAAGRNRITLDAGYPSGMYIVKIEAEGKQLIRKVVK
jgi:hypothetical protein